MRFFFAFFCAFLRKSVRRQRGFSLFGIPGPRPPPPGPGRSIPGLPGASRGPPGGLPGGLPGASGLRCQAPGARFLASRGPSGGLPGSPYVGITGVEACFLGSFAFCWARTHKNRGPGGSWASKHGAFSLVLGSDLVFVDKNQAHFNENQLNFNKEKSMQINENPIQKIH